MGDRDRLEYLRKKQRLETLRARSAGNPESPTAPTGNLSAGDMLSGISQNFGSDAEQVGKDIYQTFRHPIETAKSIYELAKGVVQLAIPGEQGNEVMVRAVGKHLRDSYGGIENIKRTIATHPAQALMDISGIMTGGSALAARAGGTLGRVGKIASKVSEFVDPIQLAGKGVSLAGKGIGHAAASGLGVLTGQGSAPMITGAKAAVQSGILPKKTSFNQALRGQNDVSHLVDDALSSLKEMAESRKLAYQASEPLWKNSKQPLSANKLISKWAKSTNMGVHKGWKKLRGGQAAKVDEVTDLLMEFKDKPWLHNPAGFDALKQTLNDLDVGYDPITRKNAVVNKMVVELRDNITSSIDNAVPGYKKAMIGYERSINAEKEIRRTVGAGKEISPNKIIKKLRLAMRDNVNTNFGQTAEMVESLDRGGNIVNTLAGMALNPVAPVGMARTVAGTLGGAGAATLNPLTIPGLLATSPRVVGEAINLAGKSVSPLVKGAEALGKAGVTPGLLGGTINAGGQLQDKLIDHKMTLRKSPPKKKKK